MVYAKSVANQLAVTLLEELYVKNPTPEQCKAAESFVTMVILPPEEKGILQEGLTATEWLCLNLAASGFSAEETAEKLSLARGTIKNYRERIRQKLQCKSIAQAIYKAFVLKEEEQIIREE
jgi:ATP/maltotriose-dependent transcriptional regulator MalT